MDFLPNPFWLRILLIIDLEIAPKKKAPIIAQIILSKAIAGEKPWPELIISVSGSKGSKSKLSNNINYKWLDKLKIKTCKRNNHKPLEISNTKNDIQCYLQEVNFLRHASWRPKYYSCYSKWII